MAVPGARCLGRPFVAGAPQEGRHLVLDRALEDELGAEAPELAQLRADSTSEPLRIADRGAPPNAIEAPYIVERDGWFYLFISLDSCCRGLDSTYKIAVGRSQQVTGPYLDRTGVPLLEGGGTVLLATNGAEIGPGGQSVSNGYLAYHFYDGNAGGAFRLAIRKLDWDAAGWPVAR